MTAWLPRWVARVPVAVHVKLLVAFLAIVGLLIVVGAVGLQVLSGANRRAEDLVQLQRKIAAYRQLQHDTTSQLYSVSATLLVPDERALEATLRQLNQFNYDLDRLQFMTKDEVELFGRVREDYEEFIKVVTQVIELIRSGKGAEGRTLQITRANPLAERLERLTNELVNRVEIDMVASIETNQEAYVASRRVVIGFALGSIGLALALGYALSWSLIGPVKEMDTRLRQIAAGDFSQRVTVANRDELGTLAANLNRMNEELGRLYQQLAESSTPASEAMAAAVSGLSPVIMTVLMPIARRCAKRSRMPPLTTSLRCTTPSARGPSATASGVPPSRAIRSAWALSSEGTAGALFRQEPLHRIERALAKPAAAEVHARHARRGRERHERRLLCRELPGAKSVFLLREHDDGTPLGCLVREGGRVARHPRASLRPLPSRRGNPSLAGCRA